MSHQHEHHHPDSASSNGRAGTGDHPPARPPVSTEQLNVELAMKLSLETYRQERMKNDTNLIDWDPVPQNRPKIPPHDILQLYQKQQPPPARPNCLQQQQQSQPVSNMPSSSSLSMLNNVVPSTSSWGFPATAGGQHPSTSLFVSPTSPNYPTTIMSLRPSPSPNENYFANNAVFPPGGSNRNAVSFSNFDKSSQRGGIVFNSSTGGTPAHAQHQSTNNPPLQRNGSNNSGGNEYSIFIPYASSVKDLYYSQGLTVGKSPTAAGLAVERGNNRLSTDLIDFGDDDSEKENGDAEAWLEFDPLYNKLVPKPPPSISSSPADDNEGKATTSSSEKANKDAAKVTTAAAAAAAAAELNNLRDKVRAGQPDERDVWTTLVQSPRVSFFDPDDSSQQHKNLTVKIEIWNESSSGEKEKLVPFTCSLDSEVTAVLATAASTEMDIQLYSLKMMNKAEWLVPGTCIGQYAYVQDCLKSGKDVQLQIGKLPSVESGENDALKEKPPLTIDGRMGRKLDDVIKCISDQMEKVNKEILDGNACNGLPVVQAVKMLGSLLKNCETKELYVAAEKYVETANEIRQERNTFIKRDDWRAGSEKYKPSPSFMNRLEQSKEDITKELHQCLCDHSKSSYYNFAPSTSAHFDISSDAVTDISEMTQKCRVKINSIFSLKLDWIDGAGRYDKFKVACVLYHGIRKVTKEKFCPFASHSEQYSPLIHFDSWISFDLPMCIVPRESVLLVILFGQRRIQNDSGGGTQASSNASTQTEQRQLAWCRIPLFDHQGLLRQGRQLLPTTDSMEIRPYGPEPYVRQSGTSPVLISIEFPTFERPVLFPPIIQMTEEGLSQRHSRNFDDLDEDLKEELRDIITRDGQDVDDDDLTEDDRELMWEKRAYLIETPEALPLVISSAVSWDWACLAQIHHLLEIWAPMSPVQAIHLLLPQYADIEVRRKAVDWIFRAQTDALISYLPQLVEALRFELYLDSPLSCALIKAALQSRRFAFVLYWELEGRKLEYSAYGVIVEIIQREIVRLIGTEFGHQCASQKELVQHLDKLALEVKELKDDSAKVITRLVLNYTTCGRLPGPDAPAARTSPKPFVWLDKSGSSFGSSGDRSVLGRGERKRIDHRLTELDGKLLDTHVRLPVAPSVEATGVNISASSFFPSLTTPLKVMFKTISNYEHGIIHKVGDDLRQDALVLQMMGLMNQIWLEDGLNLRITLFNVLPTAAKRGMMELVRDCKTLREIQVEMAGLFGALEKKLVRKWLHKQNESEFDFKIAAKNFGRSCAGWCVGTWVLGIGDRHNDNILVTDDGHLLHIDFGRYMGKWQTLGAFVRDRAPFFLTPEMIYVINDGNDQPTVDGFQQFVDNCCRAFNLLRRNHKLFINLLNLMVCSGIDGLGTSAVKWVQQRLLLGMTEHQATAYFTTHIIRALEDSFTTFNNVIHTFAQLTAGNFGTEDRNRLTLCDRIYSFDGSIVEQLLNDMYKMRVEREDQAVPSIIYRSYKEFVELYDKLYFKFGHELSQIPALRAAGVMNRNVRGVAIRRENELKRFLINLTMKCPNASASPLFYTFFHSILRDQSGETLRHSAKPISRHPMITGGDLRLSIEWSKGMLSILVQHARGLTLPSSSTSSSSSPALQSSSASAADGGGSSMNTTPPDAYVKTYLRSAFRHNKRKTRIVKRASNPTFNDLLNYKMDLAGLQTEELEVTVWHAMSTTFNIFLGGTIIKLSELTPENGFKLDHWHPLRNINY